MLVRNRLFVARALAGLLSLTALVAPMAAQSGARQDAKVLYPEDPEERKFHEEMGFARTLTYGDTVYVSGIVAEVKPGETLEQGYERAYKRLDMVLRQAGVTWDDVVDITTFHTDIALQMPIITKVQKHFVREPYPAWVAVGVTRLIPPYAVTEFKVVAKKKP